MRWNFTVSNKNFGSLVCSFDPTPAVQTIYGLFAKEFAGASDQNAIGEFDKRYPGILSKQVTYATQALETVLPRILEQAVTLAGQIAIHRAIFELHGHTHHLDRKVRASHGTEQLERTANKMVQENVNNPRGQRPRKITAKQICAAYKKWGPKATRLKIAGELEISDTQLRTYYRSGENYFDFRRRHT